MKTIAPGDAREFLAEEIRVTANIRSANLVDALATVPRERFLPPGPWHIRGIGDVGGPPRITEDGDPRHVYHDVAIAIDAARNLYNGQPSLIARWLDVLQLGNGQRVVHIGCATGYFTALVGQMVGPRGSVQAFDIDPDLAGRARNNLSDQPWVEIHHGNGTTGLLVDADRILVHAGATHILDAWLDALIDGGHLLLPLTAEFAGMPSGIGKGMMLLVTRHGSEWPAQAYGTMPVAIYSLREVRDTQAAASVSHAIATGALMRVQRVRREPHEPISSCIVHGPTNCLSALASA
jgi:protein-L-isoaspartate(D-aspartate) O-methyltransferase